MNKLKKLVCHRLYTEVFDESYIKIIINKLELTFGAVFCILQILSDFSSRHLVLA